MRMNHCIPHLITLLLSCMILVGCASETGKADTNDDSHSSSPTESDDSSVTDAPASVMTGQTDETSEPDRTAFFSDANEVSLYEVDGQEQTYAFLYNDETFYAVYTPDNWKIIDSYRITNAGDIEMICETLAEVHPIHGADMESYRTAEDMAYEWRQHNLAYKLLPDDSPWKQSAKDVDINPADQGKSVYDFYKDRVG